MESDFLEKNIIIVLEEFVEHTDSYAVISIQDTHTKGFGIQFTKSNSCVDVLTLFFDDIAGSLLRR